MLETNTKLTKPTFVLKRKFNEVNKRSFFSLLGEVDWQTVITSNDAQTVFSEFHRIYKNIFQLSFPIIKVKFQYNNRKPWLTEALRECIKHKNKLYRKYIKHRTLCYELLYKNYRNELSKDLLKAEKLHIQYLLETNKNDLGKTWKTIKGIINKDQRSPIQNSFLHNGKTITDKKQIVENFNNFFTNIGPTLSKKIPFTEGNITDYLDRVQNSIFLNPVDGQEVIKIVKGLKNSSSGWDEINAPTMKLF